MCVSYLCPIKTALNAQQNYIGRIWLETSLGSPAKTHHCLFLLIASSLMILRWRFFFQPKKKETSQQIFWNTPKKTTTYHSWLRHLIRFNVLLRFRSPLSWFLDFLMFHGTPVCGRCAWSFFGSRDSLWHVKLKLEVIGDFWWGSRRNKHRVKTIAQNHVLEHIIGLVMLSILIATYVGVHQC